MDAEVRIPIGSEWEHIDGGRYRIHGHELSATGYEETGEVTPVVRYEQLFDGSFPAGTMWTRAVEDFEAKTIRDQVECPKFTLISKE